MQLAEIILDFLRSLRRLEIFAEKVLALPKCGFLSHLHLRQLTFLCRNFSIQITRLTLLCQNSLRRWLLYNYFTRIGTWAVLVLQLCYFSHWFTYSARL